MKKFILLILAILIIVSSGCVQEKLVLPDDNERITQYREDKSAIEEAEKTLDISKCKEIPDLDIRDVCYYNVAAATKDSSVCEIMHLEATKDSCYLTIGKATKNVALCYKIKTLSMQEECISIATG